MKTEKISILIGITVSALFMWFGFHYFKYVDTPAIQRPYSPFLEGIEVLDLRFNDIKYKLRPPSQSQAPVALIAIDDASVREIGRFPWSREMVAEMTDNLLKLGAKSISFDVIFAEPETSNPQADTAFAKVIADNPDRIVLGTFSENLVDFQPHQDLCVAEAFLATGGDQLVKINPSFAIDEETHAIDDLNWAPLFTALFQTIQDREQNDLLKSLGKKSPEDLSTFQKNNLKARQSMALFEYCKTWLTKHDIFLSPENIGQVETLYHDVVAEAPDLKNLKFEDLRSRIRKAYKTHPIPQYGEWTPNTLELQTPANYTSSFIAQLDADGYVRRYPLFFRSGHKLGTSFIPSMALQSFLLSGPYRAELKMATAKDGEKSLEQFNIYDTSQEPEVKIASYPVDGSGQLLINYYGRQMSLPYVSAKELFNDEPTVKVTTSVMNQDSKQLVIETKEYDKKEFFKDRSLIVGATAVGLYDLRNTPLEANYPGPELHLTMLANLFDKHFLKQWNQEAQWLPVVLFAGGTALAVAWALLGSLSSLLGFVVFILALGALDLWLFIKNNLLVHSFLIYACAFVGFGAIQVFKYFTEEKKKKELKSTFSKYVSPAVVDELLKDAANLKLGGRRERMTAFFSDVRGFTTISEKLPPEELSRVLNLYLTPMTDIVFKNSGTLDKYMGDAIMAFFGAPVKDPNHAAHACRCALESLVKLKELQKEFSDKGLPHIDIGIGINTGEMSVGNMGSNIVQNYTVMGDSVNLASRLEGINKEYGTRIVISEFTYNDVKSAFTAREIDRVRVKGKLEPVRIFELVCEGPAKNKTAELMTSFQSGYELYHQKRFAEAKEVFEKAQSNWGSEEPVSELYIERCQEYLDSPPPQDWDGVYVMKTK
ncbi:CHASE2 domain-containing protein [Bdellovibrio bacteriovorus]|uniref:CHASE2 domain-containing protein n=1 Tax=Bdellovibrio bacteriovorus TaxID=959 RepID=UPI003AA9489E